MPKVGVPFTSDESGIRNGSWTMAGAFTGAWPVAIAAHSAAMSNMLRAPQDGGGGGGGGGRTAVNEVQKVQL